MFPHGNRRQVVLFLVAVMVPFLVLVGISLRMIGQERELGEKRQADDQRHLVNQIRQELLARLERIKLQEVSALAAQEGRLRGGEEPGEVSMSTTAAHISLMETRGAEFRARGV